MTVSGMRWHLLSSDVFLINAVFIAQYCGHKRIKIVFYWIAGGVYKSAGDNYWSAMSSTNPQCSLQIRGVIYKSAGVNYWSAEKKLKCSKQTQKRSQAQNFFCSFILAQWSNFFWKKMFHFKIPLMIKSNSRKKYILFSGLLYRRRYEEKRGLNCRDFFITIVANLEVHQIVILKSDHIFYIVFLIA